MKALAALLLSAVAISTALRAHRIEQASHASSQNKHCKDTQQAPAPPSAPVSSAVNQPSPQVKQASTKSKSKYWRRGFIPPTWSSWAVFVVAFGGICVAIRSLKVLTRQTEATEKTAKAAMESVELIVSKERARIMVEVLPLVLGFPGKGKHVEFRVLFYGTTPAFIADYGCDPQVNDSPQPSILEDHLILPLMDIPSVITSEVLSTTQPAFLLPNAKLSQEDIDAINNRKKFIHFQGYIK